MLSWRSELKCNMKFWGVWYREGTEPANRGSDISESAICHWYPLRIDILSSGVVVIFPSSIARSREKVHRMHYASQQRTNGRYLRISRRGPRYFPVNYIKLHYSAQNDMKSHCFSKNRRYSKTNRYTIFL